MVSLHGLEGFCGLGSRQFYGLLNGFAGVIGC